MISTDNQAVTKNAQTFVIQALMKCPLFEGINEDKFQILLTCLQAIQKRYKKNDFVFMENEVVTSVGVVLSGSVHIIREDFWGKRTILARIESGGLFGEAFSCAEIKSLSVSVLASEATSILLLDYRKIVSDCTSACTFHTILTKNMLRTLAKKNVMLTQKIEYLTQNTTREKLMAYLSAQARQTGRNSFNIPFDRQELAEYLSVDRSAMSSALSKMRDEGILTFKRNHFVLHTGDSNYLD